MTLRAKGASAILAVVALGVLAFPVARAEFVQSGKLLVSFDAGLKPTTLPRDRLVPVTVGFKGTFENLDASDTPALQTMEVRLSRGGVIDSAGLPRCTERRLRGLTSEEALAACSKALVGDGVVHTAFRFPDGKRGRSQARMLLFNGSREILMHIYATKPLRGTFLIAMKLRRGSSGFGTILTARFPRIAAGYGYLTGFRMVLHRTFTHRGARRSYLLASCPAPQGFDKVSFELARVTYRFRGGIVIRNAAIRSCKVRGK